MAKITWTYQALEDVNVIAERVSISSEKYASFLVDQFLETVEHLGAFPKAGRKVPELNLESIREIIVQNYRIIYSLSYSDEIEILAVRYSGIPLGGLETKVE
mgnify:FL=1